MQDGVKLALPFALNNDFYTDKTDEFNVLFNPERNSMDRLYEFCDTFNDRRINIEWSNNEPRITDMRGLMMANKNIAVRVTKGQIKTLVNLIESDIPAFFHWDAPATSISTLEFLLSLGVSDIYLMDDLWYNISDIYAVLQEHEVQNRFILNKIHATTPNKGYNPKSPIFPPECSHIIFNYVDVVEADCGRPFNWHKLGVYYRAWFERNDWHGNLSEIIDDLHMDIPNDSLAADDLVTFKLNCGRHCDSRPVSHCHRCAQMFEIARKLRDKGIGVRRAGQKETDSD